MIIEVTKFINHNEVGYILHHVNRTKIRGYSQYDYSKHVISYDGYDLSTSLYSIYFQYNTQHVMKIEISEEFDILDSKWTLNSKNISTESSYKCKKDIIIHDMFLFSYDGPEDSHPFYCNKGIFGEVDKQPRKLRMIFTHPTTGEKNIDEIEIIPKFELWKDDYGPPFIKLWARIQRFPKFEWIYTNDLVRFPSSPSSDIIIPYDKINEVIKIANIHKIKIIPYEKDLLDDFEWPFSSKKSDQVFSLRTWSEYIRQWFNFINC
jgi:hypothetical protein